MGRWTKISNEVREGAVPAGDAWPVFGCESNEHNIHSFNKYLLSYFHIYRTVLDSQLGSTSEKQKKTKNIPALVVLLFQQKNQTRNKKP